MSLIEVKNLYKEEDGQALLDGISFCVEEKGVYAILGKKGAGKTALARILAGVDEADNGSVAYKDVELCLNKKQGRALKSKIGYLPEKDFFYPDMTVFEVLDFTGRMRNVSPDKRARQIKEALELVLLSGKSEALVKKLNPSEKKRLALANSLIGNTATLILDEPTARVSAEDAELIRNVIAMLGEKKTVLLFTDKVSEAEALAKYIGIMADGKMALWSTLFDIKEKLGGDGNALLKVFAAFSEENAGGAGK